MKITSGCEFGEKLINIFGLPKYTKGFELRCYVDEAVTIRCEYYPELNEGVETVFEDFELVKKECKPVD